MVHSGLAADSGRTGDERVGRGWTAMGSAAVAAVGVVALVLAVGPQADARTPGALGGTATGTPTSTPTTPTPTDVGPSPLLPNLRSRLPSDVHVVRHGKTRRLRFGSTLANVGPGPLEIVPRPSATCPKGERGVDQAVYQDANGNKRFSRATDTNRVFRRSGCMHFHPAHHHWHVDASARYWLTRAGHPTVLTRHRKVSFCLRDSRRLPGGTVKAFYGFCTRDKRQGISIAWGDLYQAFLPGQSLLLPPRAKAGTYCLWQESDPLDVLRESNENDNISVRAIRITRFDNVRYLTSNARCT